MGQVHYWESEQRIRKILDEHIDAESDVEVDHGRVNLLDPLSKNRIEQPVRGKFCEHLQPFCLAAHLKNNGKQRSKEGPAPDFEDLEASGNKRFKKWACPICRKSARPEHLEIDHWFQEQLTDVRGKPGRKAQIRYKAGSRDELTFALIDEGADHLSDDEDDLFLESDADSMPYPSPMASPSGDDGFENSVDISGNDAVDLESGKPLHRSIGAPVFRSNGQANRPMFKSIGRKQAVDLANDKPVNLMEDDVEIDLDAVGRDDAEILDGDYDIEECFRGSTGNVVDLSSAKKKAPKQASLTRFSSAAESSTGSSLPDRLPMKRPSDASITGSFKRTRITLDKPLHGSNSQSMDLTGGVAKPRALISEHMDISEDPDEPKRKTPKSGRSPNSKSPSLPPSRQNSPARSRPKNLPRPPPSRTVSPARVLKEGSPAPQPGPIKLANKPGKPPPSPQRSPAGSPVNLDDKQVKKTSKPKETFDLEDLDDDVGMGDVFDFDMQENSGQTDHITTAVDEQHEFTAEFGSMLGNNVELLDDDVEIPRAPDIALVRFFRIRFYFRQ